MKNPTSILITGASSGIGAALAEEYAAKGITLFLSGRDETRLHDVAAACRAKGADVLTKIICVTQADMMHEWIMGAHAHKPLDLVIANAGIGEKAGALSTIAREQFEVNFFGVINTIEPAITAMQKHGQGQIAIMSSQAGFYGMQGAPAYCAAKGAARIYGEGLRAKLANHNIAVNVICPGFVRSRITDQNAFNMPFFMEAYKAARIIRNGLRRNKARISFPWQMRLATWFLRALPASICDRISRNTPDKTKGG